MSRTLGQPIVIENIAGAGGTIGSARAMRANPDGYTIEMGQMGTHATAVALYPNLAYKPDIDFAPIGLVNLNPVMVVARKDFPPRDFKEFVSYVKANAGKLNMAHPGVGSIGFSCGLLLNFDPRCEANHSTLQWGSPGDQRSHRRPSRLHVRRRG